MRLICKVFLTRVNCLANVVKGISCIANTAITAICCKEYQCDCIPTWDNSVTRSGLLLDRYTDPLVEVRITEIFRKVKD